LYIFIYYLFLINILSIIIIAKIKKIEIKSTESNKTEAQKYTEYSNIKIREIQSKLNDFFSLISERANKANDVIII